MAWKIKYHEDLRIVETSFEGNMLKDELGQAVMASINEVMERKTLKFLADCSGLTGGHSLFDLYDNASKVSSLGISKEFKEAVLMPENVTAKEKAEFWEMVTNNMGIRVKLFEKRTEAIDWLNQ